MILSGKRPRTRKAKLRARIKRNKMRRFVRSPRGKRLTGLFVQQAALAIDSSELRQIFFAGANFRHEQKAALKEPGND